MTEDKNDDNGAFADQSAFTELVGTHPKAKILAVLLSEGQDITITHIAERGGMSRSTVYNHIDDLLNLNVIKQTRVVNGSRLYQMNRKSAVAKKMAQMEWELLDEYEVGETSPNQD